MSDHEHNPIHHHDPSEGFDPTEPAAPAILGFAIGSILVLIVTIVALQQYFDKIWNDAEYDKVLSQSSGQLTDVRNRDSFDLTHYMYLNKSAGQVRIPVAQARELFLKEAAAGKPFYPGKPTVPKPEEPATATAAPPK